VSKKREELNGVLTQGLHSPEAGRLAADFQLPQDPQGALTTTGDRDAIAPARSRPPIAAQHSVCDLRPLGGGPAIPR
jgi:hypothetical protein